MSKTSPSKASAHVQWMVIRKSSSHLLKFNGQTFSTEPNNLKSKHSFRFNGLVREKTLGVELRDEGAEGAEGVEVVLKKRGDAQRKPAKQYEKIKIDSGCNESPYTTTLSGIRRVINKKDYRRDLCTAALRRATAVLNSQKRGRVNKGKK